MGNVKMGAAVMISSLTEGEESIHVHVQCELGFVLISGERDDSLQPACFDLRCKKQGESWMRKHDPPLQDGTAFQTKVTSVASGTQHGLMGLR